MYGSGTEGSLPCTVAAVRNLSASLSYSAVRPTVAYFSSTITSTETASKLSSLEIRRTRTDIVSGVKISDTKFSGNHAAICTSSKPDSNLSKNSSISSAGFLQPTLE